jgi:hypothetical protein
MRASGEQWTPTVINHLLLTDGSLSIERIIQFHAENRYDLHGRSSYLIYCLSTPSTYHSTLYPIISKPASFPSDTYTDYVMFGDSIIYINNFIRNIRYY